MARTTVAATRLTGSPAANVLATEATAALNIRLAVGTTSADAVAHLRRAIADESVAVEVVDVTEEASRYIVSVRFSGLIGEDGQAPAPFDEVWHMIKPTDGSRGWTIAGIQQVQ